MHPNSPDIEKWLKLAGTESVGPVTLGRLLNYFGSVENVLGASAYELAKVEGIGLHTAEKITTSRDKTDAEAELTLAEKLGVWIIHFQDNLTQPS